MENNIENSVYTEVHKTTETEAKIGETEKQGSLVHIVLSVGAFILAIIFLVLGFYKMFAYNNETYYMVNAYVGGDAYNYIINAAYSTAYFVLTGVFSTIGIGILILNAIKKGKK